MSISTTRLDLIHRNNSVYATIETDNLFLRSIKKSDIENCFTLYSNPEVMEKHRDGTTKDMENTAARVETLAKRWLDGDPFSGFAVYIKEKEGHEKFASFAVLDHGDHPGEAELSMLGQVQFWNKEYGEEATEALLHVLAPHLAAEGYPVGQTGNKAGQPLRKIVATSRIDNIALVKIFDNLEMRNIKTELNYGTLWNHYEYNLPQKSRRMCALL